MIADVERHVVEFHDVVSIWPKMQADEFARLVTDIRENGLRDPIWTYQGKIIDGRHRYLACVEAGIEPRYQEWNGQGSLLLFVASLNQHRRHLDAGQKAMIALEIEKRLGDEAEKRVGGRPLKAVDDCINSEKPGTILSPVKSAHQAAWILGTSGTYVKDAKRIVEQAPELKLLVMDRVMSLPEAKKLAKEPEVVRQTVVGMVQSGEAKNVNIGLLEVKKATVEAQAQGAPTKPLVTQASWDRWLPRQPLCDLLLTDPPYSTDVSDIEQFAQSWLPLALSKVKESGRAYVCVGAYPDELRAYLTVQVPPHLRLLNVLVWTYKNTLGPKPHNAYKLNWQAILYYVGIHAPHIDIPLMNEQFSVQEINAPDGRLGDRYHTWQKPDELANRLIRHSTNPGDTVIDCFAGTGTFLLAAHRLGRTAAGCDTSQEMLDIARTRGCEVVSEST